MKLSISVPSSSAKSVALSVISPVRAGPNGLYSSQRGVAPARRPADIAIPAAMPQAIAAIATPVPHCCLRHSWDCLHSTHSRQA